MRTSERQFQIRQSCCYVTISINSVVSLSFMGPSNPLGTLKGDEVVG